MDLEEERQRNSRLEKMAPHQMSAEEAEWETKKAMDDYKFKLQKAEQDINTLQTNVRRLIYNTSQISAFYIPNMSLCKYQFLLFCRSRLLDWNRKSYDSKLQQKQLKGQKRNSKQREGRCKER